MANSRTKQPGIGKGWHGDYEAHKAAGHKGGIASGKARSKK